MPLFEVYVLVLRAIHGARPFSRRLCLHVANSSTFDTTAFLEKILIVLPKLEILPLSYVEYGYRRRSMEVKPILGSLKSGNHLLELRLDSEWYDDIALNDWHGQALAIIEKRADGLPLIIRLYLRGETIA